MNVFTANKDFYPTTASLIQTMLNGIDFENIDTVLEPSAGKGDIADAIMSKVEYSRRYRNHGLDMDVIELDPNLRHILKGKKYRVVYDDFLTYQTLKRYDLIIMNPCFSQGDKHLLKALQLQENGGQIVCLLNAETIQNPFSNTRKDLVRKLEEYNASIEYLEGAFYTPEAERKTQVEIAIVKCTIPAKEKVSKIWANLKNEERFERPINQGQEVTQGEFYKNIVEQYQFEVTAGIRLIEEVQAMQRLSRKSLKEDSYDRGSIFSLDMGKESRYGENMTNYYIRKVRYKYWEALFDSKEFQKLFTSNLQHEYHERIVELQHYDFSLFNIQEIRMEIKSAIMKSIDQTIIDLFEQFSHKHHWVNETSKNIHYYNGWKSNKAWIINKKVIIPFYGAYGSWDGKFKPTDYGVAQKISDIEKVFNYLDDGSADPIRLEAALNEAERIGQARKIETKYFYFSFYKKGTCHIEFKNPELLKKFNLYGSQRKGWLPPSYGYKQYKDMNAEEKAVIDEFEGEQSYNEVLQKKEYFLGAASIPMIAC